MKVIRSRRLCDRSQHHLGFAQMAGDAVSGEDLAHLPLLLRPAREGVGAGMRNALSNSLLGRPGM